MFLAAGRAIDARCQPRFPRFAWLFAKISSWCRSVVPRDFPRYRYDQIMRLGWKVFIPPTIVVLW